MDIVNSAFSLSGGTISCFIFHFYAYMTSQHLVCISESTPNLKRLVLPVRDNDILVNEFEEAANNWPLLESLTIPGSFSIELMKAIGKHCKNLSELKMMHRFDMNCAENILAYAPSLKVISLRCNRVHRDAILFLLKELRQLEVMNITHCLILDHFPKPGFWSVLPELDEFVLQEASRLKKFLFCQMRSCNVCHFQINSNGLLFWTQNNEAIWIMDEVSTLAH
ncbi:F-box/LRR-repeat protein At3g48880-like [Rosa rugosa]|uniref:F-box/LRR-repeat protein At3g48880-like n=1 Tax=Rosa rugosa TaxID=74645 RepID=UPI002B40274C|nr:F-box/LRR-repeat protein At3g48880-like [Rosa rugosa]